MTVLIPAHLRALRRIARGDLAVDTFKGITPTVVLFEQGYSIRVSAVSPQAFRILRENGLVTFERGEGSGPWPLRITDAGTDLL